MIDEQDHLKIWESLRDYDIVIVKIEGGLFTYPFCIFREDGKIKLGGIWYISLNEPNSLENDNNKRFSRYVLKEVYRKENCFQILNQLLVSSECDERNFARTYIEKDWKQFKW